MTSLVAGDHAIQFASFQNYGSVNFGDQPQGVLQLQIGSIVGGVVNFQAAAADLAPTLRPLPLQLGPRPFPQLVGRQAEVQVALDVLLRYQPVEFYGVSGIGKTVVLRHLAYHPRVTTAFPDGILYRHLARAETVSDLLQELFNAFYDSRLPTKLSDTQIQAALQNRKALILIDGLPLPQADVQALLNMVPSCTFGFASLDHQLWGEGQSIAVKGLPLIDAVLLVAQELGRALKPEDARAAEILCKQLEGHPLQIIQAVAEARDEQKSLVAIAQALGTAKTAGGWATYLVSRLKQAQQLIVALLVVLGGDVALGAEQIAALTGVVDAKPDLEVLVRRHLVQRVGDGASADVSVRYSLPRAMTDELRQQWKLTGWMERLSSYFQNWIQSPQTPMAQRIQASDAILQVLDWAIVSERWSDALTLGRLLEGVLAVSGRWDEWRRVLLWLLEAARRTGDRALEAFALHQLGTRALCQGDLTQAQTLLNEALRLREYLNDQTGIAATQHNLNWLLPPPIQPSAQPTQQHLGKWLVAAGSVIGLFLLTAYVASREIISISPPLEPLPTVSPPITPPDDSPTPSEVEQPTQVMLKLKQQVKPGEQLTGALMLNAPAPGAGVEVTLRSSDRFLAVPASSKVRVEAGTTTAPIAIQISSAATTGERVTISAALKGASSKPVELTIATPTPNPSQVTLKLKQQVKPGEQLTGTLSLNAPAPGAGVEVTLRSSDRSLAAPVSSKVRVEAGATTAPIAIQISPAATDGEQVTITAALKGASVRPVKLTITASATQPANLESLLLRRRGTVVTGVIILTAPAPDAGATITLESSDRYLSQSMPLQVQISPQASRGSFRFNIPTDRANYPNGADLTITASYGERGRKAATVNIPPFAPAAALRDFVLDSEKVQRGNNKQTVGARIILDSPAPAGGIEVALSSTNSFLASVPATVAIAPGARQSEWIPISIPPYDQGDNYPKPEDVVLTATYRGASLERKLYVIPPNLSVIK